MLGETGFKLITALVSKCFLFVSIKKLSTTVTSLCQPRLNTASHQYPPHVSYSRCFSTTVISFIWICLPKQVIFIRRFLRARLQRIQIRNNINGRIYQTRLNITGNSSILGKMYLLEE